MVTSAHHVSQANNTAITSIQSQTKFFDNGSKINMAKVVSNGASISRNAMPRVLNSISQTLRSVVPGFSHIGGRDVRFSTEDGVNTFSASSFGEQRFNQSRSSGRPVQIARFTREHVDARKTVDVLQIDLNQLKAQRPSQAKRTIANILGDLKKTHTDMRFSTNHIVNAISLDQASVKIRLSKSTGDATLDYSAQRSSETPRNSEVGRRESARSSSRDNAPVRTMPARRDPPAANQGPQRSTAQRAQASSVNRSERNARIIAKSIDHSSTVKRFKQSDLLGATTLLPTLVGQKASLERYASAQPSTPASVTRALNKASEAIEAFSKIKGFSETKTQLDTLMQVDADSSDKRLALQIVDMTDRYADQRAELKQLNYDAKWAREISF